MRGGSIGDVLACDAYSPASLEKSHPDLFWYGIHGVEMLFTVMGTGCETVTRVHSPKMDVVVGKWKDGRIGVFRGTPELRLRPSYGGVGYGTKAVKPIGDYGGYRPLVVEIVKFFRTGQPPVSPPKRRWRSTPSWRRRMEQATGRRPVDMISLLEQARREAARNRSINDWILPVGCSILDIPPSSFSRTPASGARGGNGVYNSHGAGGVALVVPHKPLASP